MQGSWANARLAETVQRAIEPYSSERFLITGPDISINSGAVIALAMTFNELCTNATKFGALNGEVRLAYEPTGFIYTLDVPLQSLAAAN